MHRKGTLPLSALRIAEVDFIGKTHAPTPRLRTQATDCFVKLGQFQIGSLVVASGLAVIVAALTIFR